MPKRKSKKLPARTNTVDSREHLRKALMRRTKAELVDMLLDLGAEDRRVQRGFVSRLDVAPAPDELEAATRQAIIDATAFDVRDINRNFHYDYAAYEEVQRNLGRLVESGELRVAMDLSLELMKQGSCQVEMSDEGLMTQDVEDCLNVVIKAVENCDLPADELNSWCFAMLTNDRIGFICREELDLLQERFRANTA